MSATADQEMAELRRANAKLLKERDTALATLARRNTEYGERIEHQSATIDVLKAMSASPGDPQPVFELIVRHANKLCNGSGVGLFEFDGNMMHLRANLFGDAPAVAIAKYRAMFPMVPNRGSISCRAILDKQTIHITDFQGDPEIHPTVKATGYQSQLSIPLMRDDAAIGVISLGGPLGGFTNSQIALLQTFAEQAVIAISSAETYRTLQARTTDLRKSLEYQTAISDVLKAISRSAFDLQPVLETLVTTAARLCSAEMAAIARREGDQYRMMAQLGFPGEFVADLQTRGPLTLGMTSVSGRAVLERQVIHLSDVAAEPGYDEWAIRLGKQRSSLGVPLMRDGEVTGVMCLARQRVEPFTDPQIELVRTFADQAVIAIENTRLLNEQREALEQQTATAEVLQVINSSPGDLAPVFDALLEKALHLCESMFGILCTFDGESFHTVAMRGVAPGYAELVRAPVHPVPGMCTYDLVLGKNVIHIADITTDTSHDRASSFRRALAEQSRGRTAVWIALRHDDALVGMINIFRSEVRPYSDRQIALLQNFAAQAVIAMENARLINETRESLEQQTATAEVMRVINTSLGDLTPVFNTILEKARRICNIDIGSLAVYDGKFFRAVATHGYEGEAEIMARTPYRPLTTQRELLRGARLIHIPDLQTHIFDPDETTIPDFIKTSGFRACLMVPLRKEDALLGFVTGYRNTAGPFSDRQIALLENFAAQAVIAMENARLLGEIRQRQEELRVTFENMGDGVAMFDETQCLVAWNSKFQEVFDLPGTLLEQHRTYEEHLRFLAARGDFGANVDTAEEIRELVASTGQSYSYERTRPDGRVIEIRRNPVPDGGFVLIFSDITERKRSEAEIRAARDAAEAAYRDLKTAQASLIQAEKMASLGQLTAGIAHEIKNPLNFVNNFASLSVDLLDELKQTAAPGLALLDGARRAEIDELTSTLASNLGKINEHGKRADRIVRGMLEHSRGSSGERRSVDLNALVEEALNLAYHGARAQDQNFNVTLQRKFGEGIAPVTLAPQDVTRVLLNLCSNGFYAARERQRMETMAGFEPTLQISTREMDDAVEIRVHDNGTGIPYEIKDRLFQPFFTTKPPGEGTGLGLSMSYEIITQQHGGSISVDSKVGEYSEITIRLPRRI